ncbi:alpha/beta hydrolase [Streptomyces sp. CA-111067]|uniref:alpha/beta hydrolase n=1 Tax=Streptomyces sp. CA-111067 TaxID=3240046 RepID=UPI003D98F679
MGMLTVDPDMLDSLAGSCEEKVKSGIPDLLRRAQELSAADKVAVLKQLRTYLVDTARDLRNKAHGLRNPPTDPFSSLSTFGLPTGFDVGSPAVAGLKTDFAQFMAAHKADSPAARAQAVKDYFATLTPLQQAELAESDPNLVGNTDGVPPTVRFAANRIGIQQEYATELAYLKTLDPADTTYQRTKQRVDTLRGFLVPRERKYRDPDTKKIITREIPRQFLVFDPAFGSVADPKATPFQDGRVAEVVGDLETAKNVAFRVPGIRNRLDNFDGFGSGGYNLAQTHGSDGAERTDTAVVSWMGYDTPEIGDSVDPAKAVTGGKELADFTAGISVDLAPGASFDVFAHSYGTLVTSKALQDGMHPDNVTFMGSPGLGPNINSVADFHLNGTHFYAMRAPGDPVSYTQGLGNDPADFPDITRLGTTGSTGHSQYWNTDTDSLTNMQKILFGDPTKVTLTHTSLDEEMTGAAELRDLVGFLEKRVPPDVVAKMGADLDPILQNALAKRTSFTDELGPLNAVLNKYNMLDRVTPKALQGELVKLSAQLAYRTAYKKAISEHLSPALSRQLAEAAMFTAFATAEVVTLPVVKALELDRLQNNVRQLFDHENKDVARVSIDGVKAWNDVKSGDVMGFGHDAKDAAKTVGDAGRTAVKKGAGIVKSAGDFLGL